MVKNKTRVAAAVLASAMMMSSACALSACSKKDKAPDRQKITEDEVWYENKKFMLESPYNDDDITSLNFGDPVYLNGSLYVLLTGERAFDVMEAQKDKNFNFNDYIINSICKYDLDGKFIEEIPLANESDADVMQATDISLKDGKIKITFLGASVESQDTSNFYAYLDTETKKLDLHTIDINAGDLSIIEETYDVGEYTVYSIWDFSDDSQNYKLSIAKDDKIIDTVDVGAACKSPLNYISNYVVVDEDTLALICECEKDTVTMELSVSDAKLTVTDKDLDMGSYYFELAQDGCSYAADGKGFHKLDDNLEVVDVLDFSSTNVNITDASMSTVAYADDNMIVASYMNYTAGNSPERFVYIFNKLDKNPNAGKLVLDVYSLDDYLSYSESEALVKFNSTNEKYFAKVSFADFDEFADDEEDDDVYGEKMMNTISDQLMIDLMSGEGPDIILNAGELTQLNNSEYLVSLSDYMTGDNGIDTSKYYSKIFEASKDAEGNIYQMPISFGIEGIIATTKDAGDRNGFTLDDYGTFVDEACNGTDPLDSTPERFIINSVKYGNIPYLKDGEVNFDCDAFRKLCEFAKDNIHKLPDDETEDVFGMNGDSDVKPHMVSIYNPDYYVYMASGMKGDVSLYGIPSVDENGPVAIIASSAAISASIEDEAKDAGWDFIKSMLDEDVQANENVSLPLAKTALLNLCKKAVEDSNSQYYMLQKMGMNEAMMKMYGLKLIDESVGTSLCDAAEKITKISAGDSAIAPILQEEISAYFAGQKSLDDVIKVINDRVTTVINERSAG